MTPPQVLLWGQDTELSLRLPENRLHRYRSPESWPNPTLEPLAVESGAREFGPVFGLSQKRTVFETVHPPQATSLNRVANGGD